MGDFVENKLEGHGVWLNKNNGNRYEGQFKDGQKHGEGIFTPNGKQPFKGVWVEGKL